MLPISGWRHMRRRRWTRSFLCDHSSMFHQQPCLLQGAELHDSSYFRLAAHEAAALDPQTRLLLEASAEVKTFHTQIE